ncbi:MULTISPECIES: siderophore-interacting protein [Streptomyces]|uniref:siderophore-interacting protein n=1 Tax=Streptomyces TaxID=1883 RepID=UPI0023AEBAF8|nr:siderophore-interacting protein [Streptomyces sp. KA12]MDF0374209.1 siderophore-interacting protein [Streptomyces sp. KA12]
MSESLAVRPVPPQRPMYVTVTEVRRLAPRMVRITLTGDDVGDFDYVGPDHLVRLFLPVGDDLPLPTGSDWWAELQAMPADRRPVVRNYTVRRIDHARRRIDIDFALHGDSGPASAWAGNAAPGDRIGVLSDGARYRAGDADWQLLVGDETAMPAIASMLEGVRTPVHAFLEVQDDQDVLNLAGEVNWLYRSNAHGARGSRTVEALRGLAFPPGTPYVWVAGESALATSVRRYLVNERGIGKERIYFCGYWREVPSAPRVAAGKEREPALA